MMDATNATMNEIEERIFRGFLEKWTPKPNERSSVDEDRLRLKEAFEALLHEYSDVQQSERYNVTTGMSEDFNGNSHGHLDIHIREAKKLRKTQTRPNVLLAKPNTYVVISIDPSDACSDCPVQRTETLENTSCPKWDERFTFSPIVDQVASIHLDIMHASTKRGINVVLGQIEIPLLECCQQTTVEGWYPVVLESPVAQKMKKMKNTGAQVFVSTTFTFSKLLPLRMEMKAIQHILSSPIGRMPNDNIQVDEETPAEIELDPEQPQIEKASKRSSRIIKNINHRLYRRRERFSNQIQALNRLRKKNRPPAPPDAEENASEEDRSSLLSLNTSTEAKEEHEHELESDEEEEPSLQANESPENVQSTTPKHPKLESDEEEEPSLQANESPENVQSTTPKQLTVLMKARHRLTKANERVHQRRRQVSSKITERGRQVSSKITASNKALVQWTVPSPVQSPKAGALVTTVDPPASDRREVKPFPGESTANWLLGIPNPKSSKAKLQPRKSTPRVVVSQSKLSNWLIPETTPMRKTKSQTLFNPALLRPMTPVSVARCEEPREPTSPQVA